LGQVGPKTKTSRPGPKAEMDHPGQRPRGVVTAWRDSRERSGLGDVRDGPSRVDRQDG